MAFTGLSENIEPINWDEIEAKSLEALTRDSTGVLITFGTDSLEQLARRLDTGPTQKVLTQKGAKFVITAANDDISVPTTDAWDNLGFGLDSVTRNAAPGIYVAFHGRLIPAQKVVKKPFDPTSDKNMDYLSREDPEYAAALQKQKARDDATIASVKEAFGQKPATAGVMTYPVNIVRPNHREFLAQVANNKLRAILLILYHSGTANTENPASSVSALVEKLRKEQGLVCFGVTENGEPVDLHAYETSVKLRQAGVVPLYDMSQAVALAKLQLINPTLTGGALIREMLNSRVGEIDESRIIDEDIRALEELYQTA